MKDNVKIGLMIGGGVAITAIAAILIFGRNAAQKVLSEAKRYVGIREIYNDQGWHDKAFEQKMRKIGWQVGWQWCACFVQMVMCQVAKGEALKWWQKHLSPSAPACYNNIKAAGKNPYAEIIAKPESGCIVVYSHHIEFCESVSGDNITSISGNSQISTGVQGVKRAVRNIRNPFAPILGYIRIKKIS